jgi:hypothetical protein
MKKYYPPSPEDFYVGMIYESHEDPRIESGWAEFEVEDINDLFWLTKYQRKDPDVDLRIKFLDIEDIESLGWKRNEEDDRIEHIAFTGEDYNLYWCDEENEVAITYDWGSKFDDTVWGDIDRQNTCFVGIVYNKAELKKLLKQLGYEDKS